MSLSIEKAGVLSLLQDSGRYGYQDIGVTTGGAIDSHAYNWANKLLDNAPETTTQIEITMGAFKARFNKATTFAICGADSEIKLSGKKILPWSSYHAKEGDLLEIGYAKKGLRSYLSVSGGFLVTKMLNSSSTVMKDKLGGLTEDGKQLLDGDIISYAPKLLPLCRSVPSRFIPDYKRTIEIGVLPTYQFYDFSDEARHRFFNSEYRVTPDCNRMGYRLEGEPVQLERQKFVSEGIALGAIQIPSDGQPIILMRDRQTIGGYPKMGCVCNADLNLLAQAPPGTKIRFVIKDLYEAEEQLYIEQDYFFNS